MWILVCVIATTITLSFAAQVERTSVAALCKDEIDVWQPLSRSSKIKDILSVTATLEPTRFQ